MIGIQIVFLGDKNANCYLGYMNSHCFSVYNRQNAEDNEYEGDVEPSLEFVITRRDVAGVGAPATLLVFNNEKGFTRRNIDSLCSVGRSTKRDNRQGGYIGEKGTIYRPQLFYLDNHLFMFLLGKLFHPINITPIILL